MSEVLEFVKNKSYENVAIKSSAIIGFDAIEDGYRVYITGGAHIDVNGGFYVYMQLKEAMEGE